MFTFQERATILAALLFWKEEMCPHGPEIMRPYFETFELPPIEPLSADEIDELAMRLRNSCDKDRRPSPAVFRLSADVLEFGGNPMTQPPLLIRAARRIHEQLEAIGSVPPTIALPEGTWQECQRLIQLTQVAEHRGWQAAAEGLNERLASALASLRCRVDDAIVAFEPKRSERVPTLRQVYEELRSLWAEFDEAAVDLREHRLSVTTAPIVLEDVELGRFEIRLDWRRLDCHLPYDVAALDPNSASSDSGTTHPHLVLMHFLQNTTHFAPEVSHAGPL